MRLMVCGLFSTVFSILNTVCTHAEIKFDESHFKCNHSDRNIYFDGNPSYEPTTMGLGPNDCGLYVLRPQEWLDENSVQLLLEKVKSKAVQDLMKNGRFHKIDDWKGRIFVREGYSKPDDIYYRPAHHLPTGEFDAVWNQEKSSWTIVNRYAMRKAARDKFASATGVSEFVKNQDILVANPFPYRDKVIAVRADFSRMTSENEAEFGKLLVSGLSATQFTEANKPSVLAIRISGLTKIKTASGGKEIRPSGVFSAIYFCSERDCGDIIDPPIR